MGYRGQTILTSSELNNRVKQEETFAARYADLDAEHAPIVHLKIIKRGNTVEGYTTKFSADGSDKEIHSDWNFSYALPPKAIGIGMTTYTNLKKMLEAPRLGFISRNSKARFSIDTQHYILKYDEKIICLHENAVYEYKNGNWVNSGTLKDHDSTYFSL